MEDATPLGQEAGVLVGQELVPAWERVRRHVLMAGMSDEPISRADECLSPSDFGFHNAILAADGRLRFIDFEYAGWDDPAKMVCDFFCQPALPVPRKFAASFSEGVVKGMAHAEMHLRRIALLRPVYRIKWCCIMLNHFLPVGSRRRRFAREQQNENEWKREQLQKVRTALQNLEE